MRDGSRIVKHFTGVDSKSLMLDAMQVDILNLLLWSKTKYAEKGKNKPKPIFELLTGKKKEIETASFETEEDFDNYWKQNGGG